MPESHDDQQPGPRDLRRRDARVRYSRHVHDLLDRRADLQGVSPLADLIHDATHWAA